MHIAFCYFDVLDNPVQNCDFHLNRKSVEDVYFWGGTDCANSPFAGFVGWFYQYLCTRNSLFWIWVSYSAPYCSLFTDEGTKKGWLVTWYMPLPHMQTWHHVHDITDLTSQTWHHRLGITDLTSQTWHHRLDITDLTSQTWHHRLGITDLTSQTWHHRLDITDLISQTWHPRLDITDLISQTWHPRLDIPDMTPQTWHQSWSKG